MLKWRAGPCLEINPWGSPSRSTRPRLRPLKNSIWQLEMVRTGGPGGEKEGSTLPYRGWSL